MYDLGDRVTLRGTFINGKPVTGVVIDFDDETYNLELDEGFEMTVMNELTRYVRVYRGFVVGENEKLLGA
jgi:hypothetical protein